jgi:hypothetical protein
LATAIRLNGYIVFAPVGYSSWIDEVRKHCKETEHRYKPALAFAQNKHPALQALAAEGGPILV